MKKLIAILSICLFTALNVKSQSVLSWPQGTMTVASVTATTKVPTYSVTPTNLCYMINITVDTSLVLKLYPTTNKLKAGAILYVNVTNGATGATRTITGSTACTMASYTMTSAKTHFLTFVYDGTNYINTGVIKVN